MELRKCHLKSFSVLGKEGCTEDKAFSIEELWDLVYKEYDEIANLVELDEKGTPICWGLMSDINHQMLPWEDFYKKGLYLAGFKVKDDVEAPNGFKKWTVKEQDYVFVEVTKQTRNDTLNHLFFYYLDYILLNLDGAFLDFFDKKTGKQYLYAPYKERVIVVKEEDEFEKISYCGNHCGYCFFPQCGGCKTNENFCSYAIMCEDKKCPNATCCIEKGIQGCFKCDDVETCRKGFFQNDEQGAKAAAIFIKREGLKAYEKALKTMIMSGMNIGKDIVDLETDERRLECYYKYYVGVKK